MAEGRPEGDDEDFLDMARAFIAIREREYSPAEHTDFMRLREELRRLTSVWHLYTPANLNTLNEIYTVRCQLQRFQRWSLQNPTPLRQQILGAARELMPMSPEVNLVIALSWDARRTLSPEEYRRYRAIWDDVRSALIEGRFGAEESRDLYRRAFEVLRPYENLRQRLEELNLLNVD